MKFCVAIMALPLALLVTPVQGEIVLSGGGADLTFFYDRPNSKFDVVLRTKGSTDATGLTDPYTAPMGAIGTSSSDYNFDSLRLNVASPQQGMLNGNLYNTIGPSSAAAPGRPDLGLRTRFREQVYDFQGNPIPSVTFDQFENVQLTLDWANSVKPNGAEFAIWNTDPFGNPNQILFETANGQFATDFPSWGHSHWIYGFSQPGEYELQMGIQGIGGALGNSSVTPFSFSVTAVPEPMTGGFLAAGLGCLAVGRFVRRRRRAVAEVAA